MRLKTLLMVGALSAMVPVAVRADVTPPPSENPKPPKGKDTGKKPRGKAPRPVGRAVGTETQKDPGIVEGKLVDQKVGKRVEPMASPRPEPKPPAQPVGTQRQVEEPQPEPRGTRVNPDKKTKAPEFGDPPAK